MTRSLTYRVITFVSGLVDWGLREAISSYSFAFEMSEEDLVEETQGLKDLREWLLAAPAGERKRTANGLATTLGISQPAVRSWLERRSRPTAGPLRDAVCRITGSHPDRWVTEEDREEAAKFGAVAPFEEPTGDIL